MGHDCVYWPAGTRPRACWPAYPRAAMCRPARPRPRARWPASPRTAMFRPARPCTRVHRPARPCAAMCQPASPRSRVGRPARPRAAMCWPACPRPRMGRLARSRAAVIRLADPRPGVKSSTFTERAPRRPPTRPRRRVRIVQKFVKVENPWNARGLRPREKAQDATRVCARAPSAICHVYLGDTGRHGHGMSPCVTAVATQHARAHAQRAHTRRWDHS